MSDNFAIKNQNDITFTSNQSTSEVNRIGNALVKGKVGGVSDVAAPLDDTTSEELNRQKEAAKQQAIDNAIKAVIAGTDLTLEEAKKMLEALTKNKSDSNIDSTKALTQVLNCLKYAIADCTLNGKLDKEKLQKVFGCYIFMTMQSDKKNVSCDDARKVMKMSLIQFIKSQNPKLKDKKEITAADVKDSLKVYIKQNFTKEKLEQLKNAPQEAKDSIKSLFGMFLGNCSDEERKLLFEAFVMLLQDEDMVEFTPVLVKEICSDLKNEPGKLHDFLTKDLRPILEKLGFKPQTIDKLVQLGLIENLNADNIEELLTKSFEFLQHIEPQKLNILLEALDVYLSGGTLTKEQMEVLTEYQDQLNVLIGVVAGIANNPEILQGHEELFEKLMKLLGDKGLDNHVFMMLQDLFKQYPDQFSNLSSKDDLIKNLNKLTDNKYGEVIGDQNPDNLYKESDNKSSGLGFGQSGTSEAFWSSLNRKNELSQAISDANKNNEQQFLVLTNSKNKKSVAQLVSTPHDILQSVRTLSAKDLHEYLANNDIKIDDILNSYKDLTSSAKLYVNKLIEIMSPAEQSFRLDGMANTETLEIIRHAHLNPEDLNLALDFASQKELEKMEEEKSAFSI